MDTPEKRREALGRRSRKAPVRQVREPATRAAGHEDSPPADAEHGTRPGPIRPLTPEDLAGGPRDTPSQAEGERNTVEDDLRIQDERRARARRGDPSRRGG